MVVPFGFSIGDFISVAASFRVVCLALRDSGGASTEYQETINHVESINAIVTFLQSFQESSIDYLTPTSPNKQLQFASLFKAINGQAEELQLLLKKFIERTRKYDPALGATAPKGFQHGVWSKAKWGLHYSKEVAKMRPVIASRAMTIQLLFQTLQTSISVEVLSQGESKRMLLEVTTKKAEVELAQLQSQIAATEAKIFQKHEIHTRNNEAMAVQITKQMQTGQQFLESGFSQLFDRLNTIETQVLQSGIENRYHTMQTMSKFRSQVSLPGRGILSANHRQRVLKKLHSNPCNPSASLNIPVLTSSKTPLVAHTWQECFTFRADQQLVIAPFLGSETSTNSKSSRLDYVKVSSADTTLVKSGDKLPLQQDLSESVIQAAGIVSGILHALSMARSGATKLASITFNSRSWSKQMTVWKSDYIALSDYISHLEKHLRQLLKALLGLYAYLKFILPKLTLLINAIAIRSPLQLNIIFEDVLGRRHGLPWQYFRNWRTFKSMLEREFENCPGEEEVIRGDYRLVNAKISQQELTQNNWERSVFPGTEILMSVLIKALKAKAGQCARRGCMGALERKQNLKEVCNTCGLEVILPVEEPRITEIFEDTKVDGSKEQRRHAEHEGGLSPQKASFAQEPQPVFGPQKSESISDLSALSQMERLEQMRTRKRNIEKRAEELIKEETATLHSGAAQDEDELFVFKRIHFPPVKQQTPPVEQRTQSLEQQIPNRRAAGMGPISKNYPYEYPDDYHPCEDPRSAADLEPLPEFDWSMEFKDSLVQGGGSPEVIEMNVDHGTTQTTPATGRHAEWRDFDFNAPIQSSWHLVKTKGITSPTNANPLKIFTYTPDMGVNDQINGLRVTTKPQPRATRPMKRMKKTGYGQRAVR